MSNLSTPAPAHKGEAKPRYERVAYFIVKTENGREYVVKVEDGKQTFLLRGAPGHGQTARERSFDAILEDLHAAVYEANPEQLIEATLGEPCWKYSEDETEDGDFRFVEKAPRLFDPPPEPEPEKPQGKKSQTPVTGIAGGRPICPTHNRPMHKDGTVPKTGAQKWRCSVCQRENKGKPRGGARSKGASAGDSNATGRTRVPKLLRKNPQCDTCGERLRKGKSYRRKGDGGVSVYWKCVNRCAFTGHEGPNSLVNRLPDTFEEVVEFARKKLKNLRGYHPQDFEDILQEVSLDLWQKKLKPKDLNDRERMRGYIHSQARHSQDKFERPSLDAPLSNEEPDGQTYADRLESPTPNPEEELMAKEEVEEG